jgi:hypothetical protein
MLLLRDAHGVHEAIALDILRLVDNLSSFVPAYTPLPEMCGLVSILAIRRRIV